MAIVRFNTSFTGLFISLKRRILYKDTENVSNSKIKKVFYEIILSITYVSKNKS